VSLIRGAKTDEENAIRMFSTLRKYINRAKLEFGRGGGFGNLIKRLRRHPSLFISTTVNGRVQGLSGMGMWSLL